VQVLGKGLKRANRLRIAVRWHGNENLRRPNIHSGGIRLEKGQAALLSPLLSTLVSGHVMISSV
jgi:hypothetical protein